MKRRHCPSKRKEDCGGNDTKKKNCETRPCPLWSEWSYNHTEKDDDSKIKKIICWNELKNEEHFCHLNQNNPQKGTKTKYRDCQG